MAAGPLRLLQNYRNVPDSMAKPKPAPVAPEIAARMQKLGLKV